LSDELALFHFFLLSVTTSISFNIFLKVLLFFEIAVFGCKSAAILKAEKSENPARK